MPYLVNRDVTGTEEYNVCHEDPKNFQLIAIAEQSSIIKLVILECLCKTINSSISI